MISDLPPPFPDASVDFLYISHMLHHLYRADAAKLLGKAIRRLKPHATIRIVVPDLEYIMSLYQQGKRERVPISFLLRIVPQSTVHPPLPIRLRVASWPAGVSGIP